MSVPSSMRKILKSLGTLGRQSVSVASSSLVEVGPMPPRQTLPWKIRATRPEVSLLFRAADNREFIRQPDLRQAYRQETISFPWRAGVLLMLDNLTVAHGREPVEGDRKVAVGMSEPGSWSGLG